MASASHDRCSCRVTGDDEPAAVCFVAQLEHLALALLFGGLLPSSSCGKDGQPCGTGDAADVNNQ